MIKEGKKVGEVGHALLHLNKKQQQKQQQEAAKERQKRKNRPFLIQNVFLILTHSVVGEMSSSSSVEPPNLRCLTLAGTAGTAAAAAAAAGLATVGGLVLLFLSRLSRSCCSRIRCFREESSLKEPSTQINP